MKLSDTAVGKFQKIVLEEYGLDMTSEQAKQEAESLMDFAYFLLRPPKEK